MFKTGRDRQRVQLRKRTGGPLSCPGEGLASAGALGRHSVLATPKFRPGEPEMVEMVENWKAHHLWEAPPWRSSCSGHADIEPH